MSLKNKIIHESLKLFSLKGFESTSLHDILSASTASKGGFYNHFASKDYAIGYAIYRNVSSICLYGIDYTYKDNIYMAESGRACTEFWCATAVAKGIKVEVAHRSGLLDTNVPDNERLYGKWFIRSW